MLANTKRARQLMEQQGIDALLATTFPNVYYWSGLRSLVQMTAVGIGSQVYTLVSKDRMDRPVVVVPSVDADCALDVFEGVSVVPYATFFRYVAQGVELNAAEKRLKSWVIDAQPKADAFEALLAALEQIGLTQGTLGVDETGMNPAYLEKLSQKLPGLKVKPSAALFRSIRMVKTGEEISRLRKANQITQEAMLQAVGRARKGMTEQEMAQEFQKAQLDRGARLNFACLHFGRASAFCETAATDAPLHRGDLVWIDAGCYYQDYASDLTRDWAYATTPGKRPMQIWEALLAGEQKGLEAIKPGARTADIFHTVIAAVRAAGLRDYKRHHVGHCIGLDTYDSFLLAPSDETVLEEGMVMNIEVPYYELGTGGFNPEDAILVTHDGNELLSTISRELQIVG